MTKSRADLKTAHDAACLYPHTTPEMFQHASLIRLDTHEIIVNERTSRTLITTSSFAHRLPGTATDVPTYNIALPGADILQDRIAILGIGSNSAPAVLLKKFNQASIGGEIYLAQATMEKHAVAHSALVGAQAYMPATIIPDDQTNSYITVGFYTPEQAELLTRTEPNYDLVQTAHAIPTRALAHNPVLQQGALLYVSIWGAFTEDGHTPALQQGILQDSPHKKYPTAWSAARAAALTFYGNDVLALAAHIKPGLEHLPARLAHTMKLHPQHALPAAIRGTQIKEALLYSQAAMLPSPFMLPRIKYL